GGMSELLIDEGRRRVLPGPVDHREADDDRQVVHGQDDQPERVGFPRASQPVLDISDGRVERHAALTPATRRSMSAIIPRGVAHASLSNSAGEIVRPKACSNATIKVTVPSESRSPDV